MASSEEAPRSALHRKKVPPLPGARIMPVGASSVNRSVVFIGGGRYSNPLDDVTDKKFRTLAGLGEFAVIGFSSTLRPQRFRQHADFYLLPNIPMVLARYAAMLLTAPLLVGWRARKHGVRIIVAQSPLEGVAGAIAKWICRLVGECASLVIESHGDFEEAFFLYRRVPLEDLWRRFRRLSARLAFRQADVLRAVSVTTRNQLERSCPGRPVVQFPTWTDLQTFLEAGERRDASDRFTVLYAGVLSRIKGVHVLLDAIALAVRDRRDIGVVIVGPESDPAYAAWLHTRTSELGLAASVRFTGRLTQPELARQMAAADVLVLPSLSEGLARVLLEAMACGTPVVASDVGGSREIVRHKETGFLVPPSDARAISRHLLWLASHSLEAHRMGARGREAVRTFFSADRYREGYEQLFDLALRAVPV